MSSSLITYSEDKNWKLKHSVKPGTEKNSLCFSIEAEHLYDYKSSNLWSINADISLAMMIYGKTIKKDLNCHFNHHSTIVDFDTFLEIFHESSDENEIFPDFMTHIFGCIRINSHEGLRDSLALRNDISIIGSFTIDINNKRLIPETYVFGVIPGFQNDFSSSTTDSTVTIRVGDHKFNIDRHVLICFSKSLRKMLVENDSYKIDVSKEVTPYQFHDFLQLLYRREQVITNENVQALLEIAVTSDIQFLVNDCEDFLLSSQECSVEYKIWLAEKFELSKLQVVLLENLSMDDIKRFVTEFDGKMGSRNMEAFLKKICNEDFEPKPKRPHLSRNTEPTQHHHAEIGFDQKLSKKQRSKKRRNGVCRCQK